MLVVDCVLTQLGLQAHRRWLKLSIPDVKNTCITCDGIGEIGEEICPACVGTGALPVKGTKRFLKEQIPSIKEKCDTIHTQGVEWLAPRIVQILSKLNVIIAKLNE